jgi:valyl-tRNA synthetase
MRGWLSLLHPIVPFVTEAIAARLPDADGAGSLVAGPWPDCPADWIDPEADAGIEALQEFVGTVRALRAEYGVEPGTRVRVRVTDASPALRAALAEEEGSIARLAGLSEVEQVSEGAGTASADRAGAHAVLRSGGELFLPLEGVIDLETERGRIRAELERTANLLARSRGKLENRGFLGNAPEEVIAREREKVTSLGAQRTRLEEKLRSLRVGV